jgi:hypothetical protein
MLNLGEILLRQKLTLIHLTMKKLLLMAFVASITFLISCDEEEDPVFQAPVVTAPANQIVQFGEAIDLAFNFSSEAGYKSSTVAASNGNAVIKTDATAGSTSGTIVVTFTGGSTAGAGSALLTVTDKENRTGSATAVLTVEEEETVVSVTSNITENTTWESGKVYTLESRISVVSGVTLIIEPGVIVKGQAGTGANATALLIARGGKIMAEGTADSPIIFTSIADEIMPGEIASPNLDPDLNGLWGGLLILGNAPISADASSVQIEGIPPSDPNGLYGGDNPTDNSGVVRYISIRHGGANIGEGNEINGLTLGGVGSGTIIENIEIIANQDDGIEWFGGTVTVKNAVIWNVGDDGVDTDQAWGGTLDNFAVICGSDTDHALEIDGPEGSLLAGHTVKNGSAKGNPASELGDFRSGARGAFQNIYFFNFPDPAAEERGDLSLSGDPTKENFANGILTFSNLQATLPDGVALDAVFKNGTSAHASAVVAGQNTVGVDKSKFQGWSWASLSGALDDF